MVDRCSALAELRATCLMVLARQLGRLAEAIEGWSSILHARAMADHCAVLEAADAEDRGQR